MSNLRQLTRYSLLLTLISWAALTLAQSSNQSGTTALPNAQSDSGLPLKIMGVISYNFVNKN